MDLSITWSRLLWPKWEERFFLCGAAKVVVTNSKYLANRLIEGLILKCKVTTGRQWRNTFPQAKHKPNKKKCNSISKEELLLKNNRRKSQF
jgi:hypothetical protein